MFIRRVVHTHQKNMRIAPMLCLKVSGMYLIISMNESQMLDRKASKTFDTHELLQASNIGALTKHLSSECPSNISTPTKRPPIATS